MVQSNLLVSSGVGNRIDTFTTATQANLRQAIVIADPSTDANTTPVHATLGAGVNILGITGTAIVTSIAGAPGIGGDTASAVTDAGNPVKIGGKTSNTLPTAVTSGQRIDGWLDRHGNIHVRDGIQTAAATVWTQIHVPAANTQATKSQGAGAAGVRNVCTGLTVVLAATATAPTAVNVTVNLIDGASAGTTYLWRSTLSLPATAGETRGITRSGLWLPGTAATAMTLEFSAAAGANTIESVSFEGLTITE